MAIADGNGLPIAISVGSATPHEVKLVESTLMECMATEFPQRLIGDKAYDSDKLDKLLLDVWGIELIAPHKKNRKAKKTQDGRALRRYKRRWKIERLFSWLQNFRRIGMRHEIKLQNYLGFIRLGMMKILLRQF